jgi:hypothetical protein
MRKSRLAIVATTLALFALLASCNRTVPTTSTTSPSLTTNPLTSTPTVTTTATPPGPSSVAVPSFQGLALTLSLDTTTPRPGQKLIIRVGVSNTLARENTVTSAKNWQPVGLTLGPCGTTGFPFGIAYYKGYYDADSVASATPLYFYNPNLLPPCAAPLPVDEYVFQPSSDIALGRISGVPDNTANAFAMEVSLVIGGYWPSTPSAVIGPFTRGDYTIVAGDEWGTLAVLHFTIAG